MGRKRGDTPKGGLPEGWKVVRLGDLLQEHSLRVPDATGPVPSLSLTKADGLVLSRERFARVLHNKDVSRYRLVRRNDIVVDPMLLWDGALARLTRFEQGFVSPDYRVYEPTDLVEPAFLDHLLRTPKIRRAFQDSARGTNVRRNRIGREDFLEIRTQLPPLAEQRSIAEAIELLEVTLGLTAATASSARALRAVVTTEIFLEEQVRGSAANRGSHPVAPSLKLLGELCTCQSGGTPPRENPEFWNGGIPWVKTGEINSNIITSTEEFISPRGLANSSAKLLPPGTILMAMYGQGSTRGKVAVLGIEASCNQACLAIVPGPEVDRDYLFYFLASQYERLRAIGNATTQPNLSSEIIRSLVVPVPTLEKQQSVSASLSKLRKVELGIEMSFTGLQTLKSALLSDLLSGRVRVPASFSP